MGQKTHPIGYRLGYNYTWSSRWYAGKDYAKLLHQDVKIRKMVKARLYHAGVSKVEIERKNLELVDLAVANKKKEVEIKILELNETMQAIGSVNPQIIQALAMSKVGSSELIAMAFGDLAKSAERIGTLNITPDLLATLVHPPKAK